MTYDLVIENGLHFDGTGSAPVPQSIAVKDGRVVAAGPAPLGAAKRRVDARGKWVLPGFVDMHTHYDAELLAAIRAIAPDAPARLPERTDAKPIANSSAIAGSLPRPLGSTGTLASPHLRVSINQAARASAR